MIKETNKLEIEIVRRDGKSFFKFKVSPIVEKFYKNYSTEIKTSQNWPELRFYSVPELHNQETYSQKLMARKNYALFNRKN